MLDFLYEARDSDRDVFGDHWCGPESFNPWEPTLVAVYEPEKGSDGHKVEVYCQAAPARFYKIKVLDWPNSVGEVNQGWEMELSTGSGEHTTVALLARKICDGMLELRKPAKTAGEPRDR